MNTTQEETLPKDCHCSQDATLYEDWPCIQESLLGHKPITQNLRDHQFYYILGPCPSRGALVSGVVTLSQNSFFGQKHFEIRSFLLSKHFLVAMVTNWSPWQHIGFHNNTYPLFILPWPPIPTSISKIGQYRALKRFFHHHSNCCQGNLTRVVFLSLGSKGTPSCKILMRSAGKHQQ